MHDPRLLPPGSVDAFEPAVWLLKAAGAIAGTLVSIAYIVPASRRDAVSRLTVGFVTGFVFGGTAGAKIADWLGLLDRIHAGELALIGASATSLCAWWGMGALQRMSELWPPSSWMGPRSDPKDKR